MMLKNTPGMCRSQVLELLMPPSMYVKHNQGWREVLRNCLYSLASKSRPPYTRNTFEINLIQDPSSISDGTTKSCCVVYAKDTSLHHDDDSEKNDKNQNNDDIVHVRLRNQSGLARS